MPHLTFISFIAELPCILPSSEITKKEKKLSTYTNVTSTRYQISAIDKHEECQKLNLFIAYLNSRESKHLYVTHF